MMTVVLTLQGYCHTIICDVEVLAVQHLFQLLVFEGFEIEVFVCLFLTRVCFHALPVIQFLNIICFK